MLKIRHIYLDMADAGIGFTLFSAYLLQVFGFSSFFFLFFSSGSLMVGGRENKIFVH